MSEKVKITVRDNGSLKVQGEFEIVDVEGNAIPHEGDSTGLCRCGHSANKPFCDGSHKGTGMSPMKFDATESGTVSFCGCKATASKPLCDGAHKKL